MRGLVPRTDLTKTDFAYLSVLLVSAFSIFYLGLKTYSLHNWDEGNYAHISWFMLRDGHWLIPYSYNPGYGSVNYLPWLEKPPLLLWSQAISISLFGVSEFPIRFPAATAAFATTFVVYVFGRDLHSRRAGLFSGMVYLTIPYVYLGNNSGRFGTTDALLVFFGSLTVFFIWRFVRSDSSKVRRCSLVLTIGAAVLTFLSKGVAAGLYAVILFPLLAVHWRILVRHQKKVLLALGVTLSLALAWPLFAFIVDRQIFVEYFIQEQVLQRIAGETGPTHPATYSFMNYPYFRYFPTFTDPWGFVLLPAICYSLYQVGIKLRTQSSSKTAVLTESVEGQNTTISGGAWLFVIWWLIAVFGFFVITGNLAWYLLPMYVPLALIVGRLFTDVSKGVHSALLTLGGSAILVGLLSFRTPWGSQLPDQLAGVNAIVVQPIKGESFALALVALFTGIVICRHLATMLGSLASPLPPISIERGCYAIGVILLVFALASPPTPLQSGYNSYQDDLGVAISHEAPTDATVYLGNNATNETPFYSFTYYVGRTVEDANQSQLRTSSEVKYAVVANSTLRRLDRSHTTIATGENRLGDNISAVVFS